MIHSPKCTFLFILLGQTRLWLNYLLQKHEKVLTIGTCDKNLIGNRVIVDVIKAEQSDAGGEEWSLMQ